MARIKDTRRLRADTLVSSRHRTMVNTRAAEVVIQVRGIRELSKVEDILGRDISRADQLLVTTTSNSRRSKVTASNPRTRAGVVRGIERGLCLCWDLFMRR